MINRALMLLVLLLGVLAVAPVQAGHYDTDVAPCTNTYSQKLCASKAEAEANLYYTADTHHPVYACEGEAAGTYREWSGVANVADRRVYREWRCGSGAWNVDGGTWAQWPDTCAGGATYNPATGECSSNACASAPSITGSVDAGSGAPAHVFDVCHNSCKFYAGAGAEAGTKFTGTFYPYPAGVACTVGPEFNPGPADGETCIPTGNLSTCYRVSDGSLCAVTPRGAKACWKPGEQGAKVSPDQAEALSKTPQGQTPPSVDPLKPAETQDVGEHSADSAGNPGSSPQVIVYSNQTGQAGTGTTGSTSTGTGTGTAPSGNGSGSGSGSGDDPSGAGDAGDGTSSSDLYTPTEKTYGTVWENFKDQVTEAPIINAAGNFLTVEVPGGSCPAFDVAAVEPYLPALHFDAHCSGPFALALAGAGWLILLGAAYGAFKIALL